MAENDVTDLIDSLMNELIKLDAVVADGDAKLQRRMQVKSTPPELKCLFNCLLIDSLPRTDEESAEIRRNIGCDQDQELVAESKRPIKQAATSSDSASVSRTNATKEGLAANASAIPTAAGGGDKELGNIRFPFGAIHLSHHHHHSSLGRSSCKLRLGAILSI